MKLARVPYRCPCCKKSGVYTTAINYSDVQFGCKHGCGHVQTQIPLAEIEVEARQVSATFELLDEVA